MIETVTVWEEVDGQGYYLCSDQETLEYGVGDTIEQAQQEWKENLKWLVEFGDRVGEDGMPPHLWTRVQIAREHIAKYANR